MNLPIDLSGIKTRLPKLSQMRKSSLISALPLVLGLILIFAIITPRLAKISSFRQERKISRERLDGLKEKSTVLSDLLTQKRTLESYADLLDTALPNEKDVPQLMIEAEQIASLSASSVRTLQFTGKKEEEAAPAGAPVVSVKAVLEGSLFSLLDFLRLSERASRVLGVESLEFSQLPPAQGGGYQATVGLYSYFLPLPKELPIEEPINISLTDETLRKVVETLKTFNLY